MLPEAVDVMWSKSVITIMQGPDVPGIELWPSR
jgi:hypothetical protein